MNITWLGQSGFLIEYDHLTIVLDPYLSTIVEDIKNYLRLMPPVISPDELRADILFCSHCHFDHFDPITVAAVIANCPKCEIFGPSSIPERAETRNMVIPRFNDLQPGQTFSAGRCHFRALPARHSDPKALGLLMKTDDTCIYFSGDTLYDSELSDEIRAIVPEKIDLALLCINGQGGNMNAAEAVRLALALNVKWTIPTHYGMFAESTVEPDDFVSRCRARGISAMTLCPGVKYHHYFINDLELKGDF